MTHILFSFTLLLVLKRRKNRKKLEYRIIMSPSSNGLGREPFKFQMAGSIPPGDATLIFKCR